MTVEEVVQMCEIVAVDASGNRRHVVCTAERLATERQRLEQEGFSVVAVIRR
jgi:hypothetical protein